MKCPSCNSTRVVITGGTSGHAEIHEAMNQVYRLRQCKDCGNGWPTLEIDKAEVQRLRGLAHRTLMAEVRENKREAA